MGNFLNGLLGFFLGLLSLFLAAPLALILGIATGSSVFFWLPIFSAIVMVGSPVWFWILVPVLSLFKK